MIVYFCKMENRKYVLILGANSDVAKACAKLYCKKGYGLLLASRNTEELKSFAIENDLSSTQILKFDATDFSSHQQFYDELPEKPHLVLYSAGFLVQNQEAFNNFDAVFTMINTNYTGAVSILNIISKDNSNHNLERIIGLSSLSAVRGRKSNFIYGSTKAAFHHYFQGLRQELSDGNVKVNIFTLGYIRTKINKGLPLNQSLMMEPEYVAKQIVNIGNTFNNVPNFKWKIIHTILKILPENLVAKMP